MRRIVWVPLAVLVVGPISALSAAELPDHRWSLRGNFGINTPSDPLPGDALLAVSIGRRLGPRFGAEVLPSDQTAAPVT